ncbi:MAG: phage tail sheath subtilisin-like domain-containing protein [Blautia sp.]|nr:phage tail sheath subtilisin-like domain-containing protein [Blautia sp.]
MAGYFRVGEQKIRPGAYFNVSKKGEEHAFGAVDGVVAVLFKSSFGPLGTVKIIEREDGYAQIYGEGGTTDALREALYGGAQKLVACRIGNGGTQETVSLSADTGKVKITANYPGKMGFTVTVRKKLTDSTRKECIIYHGTEEFEKISFVAGEDEAKALVDGFQKSDQFIAVLEEEGKGILTDVNQTAFTAGTDPTVTNAEYSKGLEEVEKYYFNTICVDTEDKGVHELVSGFLDRIYDSGQFGIGVIAEKDTQELEERMAAAAGFDKENMVYILNAKVKAKDLSLEGYQVAAFIAGMIAACPSNQSLTHTIIDRYTELEERLTNSQYEKAIENGCVALAYNTDNKIWMDCAINTLIHSDEDHDEGWKKVRRVKTRYELLYRCNAQADAMVGKVDNDVNGRAAIVGKLQKICNDMVQEGKLVSGVVQENTEYLADRDYCYFDIDVVDKDSAEHVYLFYKFRFSTTEE